MSSATMQSSYAGSASAPVRLALTQGAIFATFFEFSPLFNKVLWRPEACGLGTHPPKSLVFYALDHQRRGRRTLHAQHV